MNPASHSVTRRRFLQTAGIGAAASVALPSLSASRTALAEEKWQMRLATSSIQFKELKLELACQEIARLGFEAIDIWDEFDGNQHLAEAGKLGGDGLKELLAKNNLKLSAFSVYRAGYQRYAELLGKAGGGVAVRGCEGGKFKPEDVPERMKRFLDGLKPLLELAEKHNSWLAIENHGSSLLDTPDSFKAFVENNASPRVGIALAPYHLQAIKASVPDVIRTCGKQLFFFYAWQNAPDFKQLPGIGPVDMTPWLQALADIQYPRYVNPFMHGHPKTEEMSANLAKSCEYLKACYNAATKKG